MPKGAYIEYTSPPDVLKKHLRPVVKEVLKETVDFWHTQILPGHFTRRGERKYRYRRRTREYMDRKKARRGHNRPLEFTGDLKRAALRQARISGTSRSARVTMYGLPWYATKGFGKNQTYADEMTAVTLAESNMMAKDVSQNITARLNKIREKKIKR